MAKLMPTAIIDTLLDLIGAATELCICSTQPTTYTEAHTTYMLAAHTLTGGDFSKAAGDTSGRKLILAAQTGFSVTNDGNAQHYALTITGSTTLLLVGTLTAQQIYAGNTVNFPATDVDEIRALA
jgi:hypothetical protein